MKTFKNLIFTVLLSLSLFTACDQREADVPEQEEPKSEWAQKYTMTPIQTILDTYKGEKLAAITEDIYIRGTITANDVSGNIYKQIQIQDETGGINIQLNASGLSGSLPVGQDIVIKCQNLFYGEYGALPQLGSDNGGQIGRIELDVFEKDHCQKDGNVDPSKIVPAEVELSALSASSPLVGQIVTVKNVYFEKGGIELYCEAPAPGANPQTLNKVLKSNTTTNTLTARISSAAKFASDTLPKGTGSVTGVLTVYNSTLQILFRDYTDCSPERFTYVGYGTVSDPYSITFALANQTGNTSGWIEGYIVGAAGPGINDSNPINGNDKISFVAPFLGNSVVLAETADVKDWTKVVVVELPSGTDIRTAINLSDNAANLGKKLKVNGTLQNKWGAAGLVTDGVAANFVLEGSQTGGGDGSETSPYNVAAGFTNINKTDVWLKAYIVGGVKNTLTDGGNSIQSASDVVFGTDDVRATAVLVADSKDEKDYTKCFVVRISDGTINPTDLRPSVNLNDHPENIGKELTVKGKIADNCFGRPGVRDVTEFKLTGEGTPVDPPTPPVGEGFFHETFGDGDYPSGSRPKIAEFNDFDMKAPYVFSDQYAVADIRSTSTINAHVWLPAYSTTFNATSQLKITGIASGYTQMKLFYDIATNSAGNANANKIVVKCNDVAVTVPSTTFSANNKYVTITLNIPDNTTSIEFFSDPEVNKEG
ncbi:MAG: DUF5689 domain-containing protein, partial [Candidatus Symbiothrix sp.]|nr:DUF5689 domain-containing protein [Candidatus Symbiothrix sp.]